MVLMKFHQDQGHDPSEARRHPNIVKAEHYNLTMPAMVMECVPGSTLAHLIHHEVGKIPHDWALPWIQQIHSALKFAHGQAEPVIHRVIKPSSIMVVSSDNTVRLMEFGIAMVAQAIDLTGTEARAFCHSILEGDLGKPGMWQRCDG